MKTVTRTGLLLAAVVAGGALLSACADERQLSDDMHASDFGRAVREDMAAQIADPDAAYKGPPPPSSGERAALAQTRYKTDKVIPPVSVTTLQINGSGSGGGGGGSSGP